MGYAQADVRRQRKAITRRRARCCLDWYAHGMRHCRYQRACTTARRNALRTHMSVVCATSPCANRRMREKPNAQQLMLSAASACAAARCSSRLVPLLLLLVCADCMRTHIQVKRLRQNAWSRALIIRGLRRGMRQAKMIECVNETPPPNGILY